MKLFGHPVHLMLIHFPAALFPMELILYFAYFQSGNTSFATASFYSMWGGVAFGWLAVLTGFIDLIKIKDNQAAAKVKALVHGTINATVLTVYSVFAYMLYKDYPALPAATLTALIIKAVLNVGMIAGNYLGGALILKHKIAVEN